MGHDIATTPGCHVIKVDWFLPVVEMPCDQGGLKNRLTGAVPPPVSFVCCVLHKLGSKCLYLNTNYINMVSLINYTNSNCINIETHG